MPPCGLWLAEDGVGKVFPQSVRLVADVPGVQKLLPLGRKARRSLSGRGGGAPRPPATLSCKADPDDYVGGLALP